MILYIYTESREDARTIWTNAGCRAASLRPNQETGQIHARIRNGWFAFPVLDREGIESDTIPGLPGNVSQHAAYATAHRECAAP